MTTQETISLNEEIEAFLKERGAIRVGFATLETLEGSPQGADIQYRLPEAKSAISYALAFDKQIMIDYIAKTSVQSFIDHEENRFDLNYSSTRISGELAEMLEEKGYKSKRILANNNYRKDVPAWQLTMPPKVSHRLVALVAGVATVGYSGNLGLKGYGAGIHLGTVVTEAELEPTEQISADSDLNFCNKCKSCAKACNSEMFSPVETQKVKVGKYTYEFAKRTDYARCQYVCGGFTGLHKSGKWSTWSPGRFPSPAGMERSEVMTTLAKAMRNYKKWPERKASGKYSGYKTEVVEGYNIRLTCGLCQVVCSGDPKETAERYKMLVNSGCVLQKPDGEIIIQSAEEAQKTFESFPFEHQRLYHFKRRKKHSSK
ncbi:MAG: hypothetical protein ACFFCS_08595 [Candidatus Hodarchaeota archaeon]